MINSLLICAATMFHPIGDSPLFYADQIADQKCVAGCYVLTPEELIAGLKNAHRAGRGSVDIDERRRGYEDGKKIFEEQQNRRNLKK
jgi:hypothetical protein